MIKINDINIRDPFILVEDGKYYMYGSTDKNIWGGPCEGFDMYESDDLINFSGPVRVFDVPDSFWGRENFWAPEVHKYKGKFYMFASFFAHGKNRATHILVADSPKGPFIPHGEKPQTPEGWECLDGTLYIEDDTPYMVFCHEWTQIGNGTIAYVRLSDDLKTIVSPPIDLFKATDAKWMKAIDHNGADVYITDGAWFHRLKNGKLLMLWSSFCDTGYAVAVAESDNGSITGNFIQQDELVYSNDGGHAMLFYDLNGRLKICMHQPNSIKLERPLILECVETDSSIKIK